MLKKRTLIYFYYAATNLYWKPLFQNDYFKDIVIASFQFLVKKKELIVYGFVIMLNHIHFLFQVPETVPQRRDIQHSLMSFTAQEFKKQLIKDGHSKLEEYYVGDADREYQFWESNPLPVKLFSIEVAE